MEASAVIPLSLPVFSSLTLSLSECSLNSDCDHEVYCLGHVLYLRICFVKLSSLLFSLHRQ